MDNVPVIDLVSTVALSEVDNNDYVENVEREDIPQVIGAMSVEGEFVIIKMQALMLPYVTYPGDETHMLLHELVAIVRGRMARDPESRLADGVGIMADWMTYMVRRRDERMRYGNVDLDALELLIKTDANLLHKLNEIVIKNMRQNFVHTYLI